VLFFVIAHDVSPRRSARERLRGALAVTHVTGLAAGQEVVPRRREEIDYFGVLSEPSFMFHPSRDNEDVTFVTDAPIAAESELHRAREHPYNLLVWMIMRLHMDASLDAPPYQHPMVSREYAPANLFTDLLLG
jgi:hypothetical protein